MINRRIALGLMATATTIGASRFAFLKESPWSDATRFADMQ
ncbi:hypothetical protein SAMN05443247_07877 [Bradyrhizobium erythrophlei]|nr:hypothetical protein SAMN05443247_07877 [Bradyrhizobium erythrophlei]